jgi:4-hydroxy-4-methyl-2-oxoglutarate aldolase
MDETTAMPVQTIGDSGLLERLGCLSSTSLVDAAPALRVLPHAIRPLVLGGHFAGRVVTARANRDLISVIHALRDSGPGDVLIVEVGGDDRAVAGELFGTEAQRRGLAALVIHGRCRDSATLTRLSMPVWATGVAPNAYAARALPETGVTLWLDGTRVEPGELIVGDDDGLVTGSASEFSAAVERAEAIEAREKGLQGRILEGASLFDVMNYEEHLSALREGDPGGLAFG